MGEWFTGELLSFCNIYKGKQINRTALESSGDYYVLNGGIEPSGYFSRWNKEAGTISISEGGNSCGYVNFNTERFWSGGHCYTLENIASTLEKMYLYFFLKYKQDEIMMLRTGTGLPNIQRKAIMAFPIFYPTEIKEQGRIALFLTAVDEAIAASRSLVAKYAAIKKGLMRDLFGSGELARLDSGIVQINPYCKEKRPDLFYYIDLEAVIAGDIIKDVIVSRKEAPSRAQRLLKPNDILFQTVRPYQQNNYLFRKERDLKTVASTGYAQLRTDNNPVYMYYSLHQDEFVREVNNRSTGSNYPAINPTELGKCSIHFEPDSAKQDRIADILTSADERLTAERERLAKLENIKRGLMDDLLTNRVSTDTLEGGRKYA